MIIYFLLIKIINDWLRLLMMKQIKMMKVYNYLFENK